MIIKRDNIFKYICQILTPSNDGIINGTGIFIDSPKANGNYCWLVTAYHIAQQTNEQTCLNISNNEGISIQIPLNILNNYMHWINHPHADLSVLKVPFNVDNEKYLKGNFFPHNHLFLEKKAIPRDYELTAFGFPKGLGTQYPWGEQRYFSPLTFRSHASSQFVVLPRPDDSAMSVYICLEHPSIRGYSGGPIFDLGYETNGVSTDYRSQTWCHGIISSTLIEDKVSTIGTIVPMFQIKDVINEF